MRTAGQSGGCGAIRGVRAVYEKAAEQKGAEQGIRLPGPAQRRTAKRDSPVYRGKLVSTLPRRDWRLARAARLPA